MKRIIAASAFCLVFAPITAAATECGLEFSKCSATSQRVFQSGGFLTSIDEGWDVGWHDGFVMGVAMASIKIYWCPIKPFSGIQLAMIVSKYMQEHPERWSDQPHINVQSALSAAFPCKK